MFNLMKLFSTRSGFYLCGLILICLRKYSLCVWKMGLKTFSLSNNAYQICIGISASACIMFTEYLLSVSYLIADVLGNLSGQYFQFLVYQLNPALNSLIPHLLYTLWLDDLHLAQSHLQFASTHWTNVRSRPPTKKIHKGKQRYFQWEKKSFYYIVVSVRSVNEFT